jgi:hypothetical protein
MTEPTYQIDLDRTGTDPVSLGTHPFTVVGFSEGEGDKGAYWKFDCQCDSPAEKGKTVSLFLSLTPASRWRLEIFLDAVNAPTSGAATADKFIGRRFRGTVKHGAYNGRPQANIEEMFPISAAPAKTVAKPAPAVVTKTVAVKKETAKQPELPTDASSGEEIPF